MKRVLLAMSGGIDSAVAAMLLLEQGFEVLGATMLLHDPQAPYGITGGCFGSSEADSQDDLDRVASFLGIEVRKLDLSADFERSVLDYYRDSYLQGRTPNPCIVCNQIMKFHLLRSSLEALGETFDHYATGHYARVRYSEEQCRWQLLKGSDPLKDQSYFLCLLTQDQLAKTIFPLGSLTKAEVRKIAASKGLDFLLPKAESQDFVSEADHTRLFGDTKPVSGEMLGPDGEQVGTHRGLIHYTIGKRRHLGISGKPEPWYVTSLDARQNRVFVGPISNLFKDRLIAKKVNWVSIAGLTREMEAEAKIRYAHHPAPCLLTPIDETTVELVFSQPQLSVTPGQFVVFYRGDMLLGGGVIA